MVVLLTRPTWFGSSMTLVLGKKTDFEKNSLTALFSIDNGLEYTL